MPQPDNPRRRTRPQDSSDDEEAGKFSIVTVASALTPSQSRPGFSENAAGRYRSRVVDFANKVDWPAEPWYQAGEVVYLAITIAGLYVVISNDCVNATYKIKRLDNDQEHPTAVSESSLGVPKS